MAAFIRTIENFYTLGGGKYYAIGMPVYEGLTALNRANRPRDHAKLLALFERHGRYMADIGARYPDMEVNYKQSILGPASIFLLELHRATGDARWLADAKPHLALLELFSADSQIITCTTSPSAIRTVTGSARRLLWGATLPHYWSTLTTAAFHHYARAGAGTAFADRAEGIIRNNVLFFTPDGRGSAAYIYPVSVTARRPACCTCMPTARIGRWCMRCRSGRPDRYVLSFSHSHSYANN